MSVYVLARDAERDLDDREYIAKDDIDSAEKAIRSMSSFPRIEEAEPEAGKVLRIAGD